MLFLVPALPLLLAIPFFAILTLLLVASSFSILDCSAPNCLIARALLFVVALFVLPLVLPTILWAPRIWLPMAK